MGCQARSATRRRFLRSTRHSDTDSRSRSLRRTVAALVCCRHDQLRAARWFERRFGEAVHPKLLGCAHHRISWRRPHHCILLCSRLWNNRLGGNGATFHYSSRSRQHHRWSSYRRDDAKESDQPTSGVTGARTLLPHGLPNARCSRRALAAELRR
jgi:hypothetical protein